MSELSPILLKFDQFKEFLVRNKFYDDNTLKELLKNIESNDYESQLIIIVEDIESKDRQYIDRFAELIRNSEFAVKDDDLSDNSDQSDNIASDVKLLIKTRVKDLLSSPKACGEIVTVKTANKIKANKYGDIYPMTSRPRGYCVIINNQLFCGLPFRTGSRADADRLSDVFSQLHFDVMRYDNLTSGRMIDTLKNMSQNDALREHDALAVIILSHGCDEGIYGTDHSIVSVDTILEFFNNQNCLFLRNKPKMFFLSACRGIKIDSGIDSLEDKFRMMSALSSSSPKAPGHIEQLPTWSDIFVYYSTISGYASLRNTTTGSWFGHELAYGLAEFAHREHLHDLVTIEVADMLQKRSSQIGGQNAKQAIETQTRGRVKKVYFNPGLSTIAK